MSDRAGLFLLFGTYFLVCFTVGHTEVDIPTAAIKLDRSPRIICRYSNKAIGRPGIGSYSIDKIPADVCTHVIYDYIDISSDKWEVLVLDKENEITDGGFNKFTGLKIKYPMLKTFIALGGSEGSGQKYSELVSDNDRRKTFIASIINFIRTYEFDGLDLVWPTAGAIDKGGNEMDKVNLLNFVREMRNAFDSQGFSWEISMVVPIAEQRIQDGYFVPELCTMVDAIHVATHDLRGYWDGFVDVPCPLHRRFFDVDPYGELNVEDGLRIWAEMGCPKDNIVMSISPHGRTYTLPVNKISYTLRTSINEHDGRGDAGAFTQEKGILSYYEICMAIDADYTGWTKQWDDVGLCPFAYMGTQWVGYENKTSIQRKTELLKENGYLGVIIPNIDMDDFQGVCGEVNPLITEISDSLKDYKVPFPWGSEDLWANWVHQSEGAASTTTVSHSE